MLNTNLTTIRWEKSLYYISEGVIFDISNIKRTNDMDDCGSFLIDFSRADNVSKNAVVGATVNLTNQTELFTGIPWLEVKFSDPELDISVPLQYLIEEGDTFTLNNVGQSHPNAYAKDYRNKFNQEIFETIRTYVNRTPLNYGETLVNQIMNILPAWLTCDVGVEMTKNYVINSFVKGTPWNSEQAINGNDDAITLTGVTLKTPMGDASISGSWNKEKIENIVRVLVAVRDVNKLNISSELMEAMLNLIIENNAQTGNGDKLNSLYHIDYDNVGSIIDSEILAKVTDANTYWQYAAIPELEPEIRHVNNIQEFKELGESGYTDEICIDENLTFVFAGGQYIMLDDNTGGLAVHNGNHKITKLYNEGDVISEGIVGRYSYYKGMVEFVPSQDWKSSVENVGKVNPIEVNDICNQSLLGKLVTINVYNETEYQYQQEIALNHNVTQISNNETIFIRNGFYTINDITLPVGNIKVTGFVWKYMDEWQLWIRDNDDIQIIEPEIRHVNNIQEFKELGESGYTDDITIDGDVTVAFVPENQRYIMLMDDTGGLVVYNENRVSQTALVAGDLIRGIVGKYKTYAGTPEFVPSQNLPNAIEICHTINSIEVNDICNQSLIGKLVTIDVYNESEYQYQQEIALNHNVTQISNNETIFIRNGFHTINDITLPVGNIKVTGFVWRYNNEHYDEWQIWCRNNDDIQIISEPEIEND